MEEITVKRPSARILGKMRRGHRVRLHPAMEGEGITLLLHPEKYDEVTHSFRKDKGISIALNPTEIAGSGLGAGLGAGLTGGKGSMWNSIKKGAAAVGKVAVKLANTPEGKKLIAEGKKEGMKAAKDYYKGDSASAEAPDVAGGMIGLPKPRSLGEGLTGGRMMDQHSMARLNMETGQKMGALHRANMGTAEALADSAKLAHLSATARGQGLYAQTSVHPMGRGIRTHRHRMIEHNSISGHLMGGALPPALQSQATSQNFQFMSRLPVAYQHIYQSN